jgi:DNA ligase-associated metallophosphoesterase
MSSVEIPCAGETLTLLAERAIFWASQRTLLIADPHFGKDATFRAAGIALPPGTLDADLTRLERVLATTGAERLIVLGDFFHARPGRTADTLAALVDWRERHAALDLVLVRGNHDRHAGPPPAEWRITDAGECLALPPFLCCHLPAPVQQEAPGEQADSYRLAGHLHPAVTLGGRASDQLRLPCFWFGPTQAILPAFGSFTGGFTIRPGARDRVYAISPAGVHAV